MSKGVSYIRIIFLFAFVCFACASENVNEFVFNDFFDVCASGFEIFSGVELVGLFVEELTNSTGHSKTEVRVDVDFTN